MDSRSYNDHKDQLYCNHCYKYLFGPKGVGYGIGAGVLYTASNKCKDSNERSEFNNEAIVTASISYTDEKNQNPGYIKFIDESFCDKSEIHSRNATNGKRHTIMETNQLDLIPSLDSSNRESGNAVTSIAVTCRRCSKEVYDAEKILAGGMVSMIVVCTLTTYLM
uniref:LITAF domain-containing protein n=1 Tax=Elaeophora elaphi TaxID=1147741 RepID=A0A0R3RIE5_9BILA